MYRVRVKKIACGIMFFLSMHLGVAAPTLHAMPASDPNDSLLIRAYSPIMASVWLFLFFASAQEDVREKFLEQLNLSSLFVNFAKQYTSWLSATLSHEAGHAFANHLLTYRSSTIHIGDPEREPGQKPIFTIGNIAFDGVNPLVGSTVYGSAHGQKISAIKTGVICASGGVSGIAGYHVLRLLVTLLSCLIDHKSIDNVIFKKALKPDQITVQHFLNVIWPLAPNSDAAQIWRDSLGLPESLIDFAVYVAPVVQTGLILGINYYNNEVTRAAPFSAFCLEMANYYLLGFLRFEV